jgi:hypothetical protein
VASVAHGSAGHAQTAARPADGHSPPAVVLTRKRGPNGRRVAHYGGGGGWTLYGRFAGPSVGCRVDCADCRKWYERGFRRFHSVAGDCDDQRYIIRTPDVAPAP